MTNDSIFVIMSMTKPIYPKINVRMREYEFKDIGLLNKPRFLSL